MQIYVRRTEQGQELSLIEMQGDLESRLGTDVDLSGKFIGDMHFTKDNFTPILIIGHHILYGKSVKLEKPLVVMTKPQNQGQDTEYQVQTIIRNKLIFKARPKPIIANVPKKMM